MILTFSNLKSLLLFVSEWSLYWSRQVVHSSVCLRVSLQPTEMCRKHIIKSITVFTASKWYIHTTNRQVSSRVATAGDYYVLYIAENFKHCTYTEKLGWNDHVKRKGGALFSYHHAGWVPQTWRRSEKENRRGMYVKKQEICVWRESLQGMYFTQVTQRPWKPIRKEQSPAAFTQWHSGFGRLLLCCLLHLWAANSGSLWDGVLRQAQRWNSSWF